MSDMTLTKVLRGMAEYLTKTLDPIDRERWALTLRDSVDEIARLQREVAEAKEKLAEREATIDILVQRIADVMGYQPDDDDDLVEAVRLLVAERDEAERDRRRDHAIVKGVHGALLDAGMTAPALEAPLYDSVMALAAQRDEARALLEAERAKRCGNCADFRDAACESETAEAAIVDFISAEMCCPHWRAKEER